MKRIFTLLLFIISLSARSQEDNIVHGDLLVMLHSHEDVSLLCKEYETINTVPTGLSYTRTISASMNIYLMRFDHQMVNEELLLLIIRKSPRVKIAQFNHTFKSRVIPNDASFASQWGMNNTGTGIPDSDIDAPEAWDITTGGLTSDGDTIVVAIIDQGFDLSHQDISFWKNYAEIPGNSIDDDGNGYVDDVKGWNSDTGNDVIPTYSHGTHVAGIAGARGNNTLGVTGVNWNVKTMALSYGSTSSNLELESNAVACYAYARDQRQLYNTTNGAKGAFVVSTNSSFGIDNGLPSSYPLWCSMFDSLGAVGILSAAATANHKWNIDVTGDIPTACTSNWMIAVTNTNSGDTLGNAGYGATTIDLGAPGSGITSTLPGNTYGSLSGTSMATPHVAGAIALMYSLPCTQFMINYKTDPAGTALIVKDSLLGAVDVKTNLSVKYPTTSGGRLNLYGAIRSMQNYCAAVGIEEHAGQELNNVFVYPNPASGILSISYTAEKDGTILFRNVLGQEMMTLPAVRGTQRSDVDISSFPGGIYFLNIVTDGRVSNVVKVIKN